MLFVETSRSSQSVYCYMDDKSLYMLEESAFSLVLHFYHDVFVFFLLYFYNIYKSFYRWRNRITT